MGYTLQIRLSDRQKQLYDKASAQAGVRLSEWARSRLDQAAGVSLIDRLVISPAEAAEHVRMTCPTDEVGRRIQEEEEAAEIQRELDFEEEFPCGNPDADDLFRDRDDGFDGEDIR